MKVYAFVANGSEDSELVTTVDVLKRGKIDVLLVSIDDLFVTLSHGLIIKADMTIDNFSDELIDDAYGLIIPGGLKGVNAMLESKELLSIIKKFNDNKKFVSAICAGPTVLSKAGVIGDNKYTCYDGFEEKITDGKYQKGKSFVVSNNVITGRSMNYSIEFGLAILEYLKGKEDRIKVEKSILR